MGHWIGQASSSLKQQHQNRIACVFVSVLTDAAKSNFEDQVRMSTLNHRPEDLCDLVSDEVPAHMMTVLKQVREIYHMVSADGSTGVILKKLGKAHLVTLTMPAVNFN